MLKATAKFAQRCFFAKRPAMFQAPANMYQFSSAPVSKNREKKDLFQTLSNCSEPIFDHRWNLIYFCDWIVDILRLEQDQQGYFINFPGRTMPVPIDMSVSEAQLELLTKYGFGEIEFSNIEDISYAASTPLQILLRDDFYLTLEKQKFFIVNTTNSNNLKHGLLTTITENLSAKSTQQLASLGGNTFLQQQVLQEFTEGLINELGKDKRETIDQQHLQLIFTSVLNQMSLKADKRVKVLKELIEILEGKVKLDMELQKKTYQSVVDCKLNKFFKRFFSFIVVQVALVQYGTYYFLSWDCMEPITCLLGILDVIIGYSYYLYANQSYSYDVLLKEHLNKIKQSRAYRKQFDEEDLYARRDMLDYLYRKLLLNSASLKSVMGLFEDTEQLMKLCSSNFSQQA